MNRMHRFHRMLLAEAVAAWRQDRPGHPGIAPSAARAANRIADPIEALAVEASLQPEAPMFAAALRRIGRIRLGVSAVLLAAAAIAGGAAVAASLPPGESRPVNTLWILGGFLGSQTLLLLLSLALLLPAASGLGASIGGMAARMAAAIASRLSRGDAASSDAAAANRVAVRRWVAAEARTPIGRWRVALLSNAAWLAFNLAGVLTAILLLSVRQYRFGWETTILPSAVVEAAVAAIAWLPAQAGLAPPDAAAIAASRFDPADPAAFPRQDDALRGAWSRLLLGAMVLYGIVPRLLLASLCGWRLRASEHRYRPDPADPAVGAAIARLRPASATGEAGAAIDATLPPPPAAADGSRPAGDAAIVGIEIETPPGIWPPPLRGRVEDLGCVEDLGRRRRLAAQLANRPERPLPLLLAVDLSTTPDRGIAAALGELSAAAGGGLAILSGGERLRRRETPEIARQRLADWHRTLESCLRTIPGSPAAIEADLDHLTAASRAAIEAAIAAAREGRLPHASDADASPSRPSAALDESFAAIAAAAPSWCRTPPDAAARADLHRRIARIFEASHPGGDLRWPVPPLGLHDPAGSLRRAAERMESLLPAPLRADPRWLAAGAAAGILGCIAAAAMATPLAISSLPLWAAAGAAASAVLDSWRARGGAASPEAPTDLFEAIAAATLQAVLFEHQGRGEATIAARLEIALPAPPPRLDSAESIRLFLAGVRERLAAAEARP
jgi:hypothetical protein